MNLFIQDKKQDVFTEVFGDAAQFSDVLATSYPGNWTFTKLWLNPKSSALHAIFSSATQEVFVHCGPSVSEDIDPLSLTFALHSKGYPVAYVSAS